jgi:hypothetical protein
MAVHSHYGAADDGGDTNMAARDVAAVTVCEELGNAPGPLSRRV